MTQLISYDLVGVKENVHDAISSISPSATPFLTMTKSEKIHNTTFSFLEDSLRNSNGANALIERCRCVLHSSRTANHTF